MFIAKPDYIFIRGEIVENIGVVFDKKIIDINHYKILEKKYPNAEEIELKKNSLMMPGFINAHTHLEFSSNENSFYYGDYISWLKSVIKNLPLKSDKKKLKKTLKELIKNGTTAIGEISSQGLDFDVLKNSPIRKVVFNEVVGSQLNQVEKSFENFQERLAKSQSLADDKFIPAVAIHSPFSVHNKLVDKVLKVAKENNLLVSAHFMESQAERDWLDFGKGDFYDFYSKLYGEAKQTTSSIQFLKKFRNIPTIFTHCNYINLEEMEEFQKYNHKISHCPISNKLLGNKKLEIEILDECSIPWNISTDGLSSNYSLNLLEELKIALFLHNSDNLEKFALKLFNHITEIPAKQLNLNSGVIEIGKDSDFAIIHLKENFDEVSKIALHTILKTFPVYKTIIGGIIV
jgi:cytosine/adenosine deaminase-related metal-dependent hydrolase